MAKTPDFRGTKPKSWGVITRERVAEVDGKYRSLQERAEDIYAIFQLAAEELDLDFVQLDLVYFCAQYLAQLVIGGFGDPIFQVSVKNINKFLNLHHYEHAEELYGKPERGSGETETRSGGEVGRNSKFDGSSIDF